MSLAISPSNSHPSGTPRSGARSTPQAQPTTPVILTLNPGEYLLDTAVVDSNGGFAYFGTGTAPSIVVKVRLSDFARVDALTLQSNETYASTSVIDTLNGYAYFGLYSGQVVKIRLSDFTRVAALPLNSGPISSSVIDSAAGYAYFGATPPPYYTTYYPGIIVKVRLSDFKVVASLTLTSGTGIGPAVIDPAHGYAYFGSLGQSTIYGRSPASIVKIRLSDLTVSASLTPDRNQASLAAAVIDSGRGYAYFATGGDVLNGATSRLLKVRLSDFSIVASLALGTLGGIEVAAMDIARDLVYLGLGNFVATVRVSDLNQVDSVFLQGGTTRSAVVDPSTGNVYFGGGRPYTFGDTSGKITKMAAEPLHPQDFSLTINPTRITVRAGQIASAFVKVTSLNFTGLISLTARVSTGFALTPTPIVSPSSLLLTADGENITILTIFSAGAYSAHYGITVTGTSDGLSRTVSAEVDITPSTQPDFLLYAQPASLVIPPGQSPTLTMGIQSSFGFVGNVTLAAKVTPTVQSGPTVTLSPSTVSITIPGGTYSAQVTIGTLTTSSPGQYIIAVSGTSTGLSHILDLCTLIGSTGTKDFCLTSDPDSFQVQAGAEDGGTIKLYSMVTYQAFNGPVNITASVSPLVTNGPSVTITSTPDPNIITSTPPPWSAYLQPNGTATLTLDLATQPNTPVGNYAIDIVGVGGSLNHHTIIPATVVQSLPGSPGVGRGEWARYDDVNVVWNSNPSTINPTHPFDTYVDAYSLLVQVAAVQGDNVAALSTLSYMNGTQYIQSPSGNVIKANDTLAPWIVAAGVASQLNYTSNKDYAGALRLVGVLNVTSSSGVVTGRGTFVWDIATGLLVEETLSVQGSGPGVSIFGLLHLKISQTNLWNPTLPDFKIIIEPATIPAGVDSSVNISLTSLNNFAGGLFLAAVNLPIAVNATIGLQNLYPVLAAGQTITDPLTIEHPQPGVYTFLLQAWNGSITHKTVLTVRVLAADFTFTASVETFGSLRVGESKTSILTVTSVSAPLGQVSLSTSAPSGIVAKIDRSSITDSGTAELTVYPNTTGNFTLTLRAQTKYRIHTITFTVSGVDFSLTPNHETIAPFAVGSSTTSTITIVPVNGFSNIVTLSASVPNGLTATISPGQIQGAGTFTLTLHASTPGDYTVIVTASSGPLSHTQTLTVQATQEPSSSNPTPRNAASLPPVVIAGGTGALLSLLAVILIVLRKKPATRAQSP